jgi:hypothetical protein
MLDRNMNDLPRVPTAPLAAAAIEAWVAAAAGVAAGLLLGLSRALARCPAVPPQ